MNHTIYFFSTNIGTCGIAWTDKGIDRVMLPGDTAKHAKKLLKAAAGQHSETRKPPVWIRDAARRITQHLAGKPDPFDGIPLDLESTSAFARKVYYSLRRVPSGTTITYEDLARLAGSPKAARAVGRAMAANPVPLIIPCHRVVASDGSLGGFSAHGGAKTKDHILKIEGVNTKSV